MTWHARAAAKCARQLVKKYKDNAEKLVEPLAGVLTDDKDGKVKAACAEALGKLEAKAFPAIPALITGLRAWSTVHGGHGTRGPGTVRLGKRGSAWAGPTDRAAPR